MINKSLDVGHRVSIEVEDQEVDGHSSLLLDVRIDGLSVGDGEIDWEILYEKDFTELPQSLRFLSAIMSGLEEFTK